MENNGTIVVLDKITSDKIHCPFRCTYQKTIDTATGVCEVCKQQFIIHTSDVKVSLPVST